MDLLGSAAGIARKLGPLGGLAARGIDLSARTAATTERLALRALRARMDAVAPLPAPREAPRDDVTPAAMLQALLERSLEQDTAGSRRDAHVVVLRQLVPDEARIIAALAEGPPAPLVHVLARAGGERILENASLIGRSAALTLPSMTPAYVTHLRHLGLVQTGPEDQGQKEGYEMLMADREVRAALKAGELSKLPARVVRRTLTLSPRGRALWEDCRP